MTKTAALHLEIPDSISEDEAHLLLAMKLYELSRVSLGQAASIAGVSKRSFMETLGRYRIPVFRYPGEELAGDVEL